ncbi:zinc-binding alcohol dehydrogenase family protein [Christensenellaceae bacterium OttesenSCG-928-M15]|nr:zinc-binding alcohol dehydrogenase family protein [Christensenellaceae bacterium OttesenSCG-928-M15]
MKAVNLQSPNTIGIKALDPPKRSASEALIKIRAGGICGSDIGAFRGTNPLVSYPRIIGHEIAGEIVEIGENSKALKAGDRVVLDPYLYCGHCYPCSIKRTNCCESLRVLGVHVDGGMAEYFTHPAEMLVKIPDGMPFEIAPLSEPLTIALHAIHRTRVRAGQHVAINGAGAIGILMALCAIAYGAEPILIDPVEKRLEYAKTLGVKHTIPLNEGPATAKIRDITNGRMAEVVMEASGANSAIRSTLDMVSHAGVIALTGWPKTETPLPTDVITRKEIDIVGCRTSAGEFEEALSLMISGRVKADAVMSKVIPFEEVPEAVRELSAHPDRYLKINFSM